MRRIACFAVALFCATIGLGFLAAGVDDRAAGGDDGAPAEAGEQVRSVEAGTCDSPAFVLLQVPPPSCPGAASRRSDAAASHRLCAGVRPVLYHPPQGSRE